MINLELLLSLSCWFSNSTDACLHLGEAYYKYEKLDEQVKEIERHIPPSLIFTATLFSSIEKRKARIPISNGTYFGIEAGVTSGDVKTVIGVEHGF